MAPVSVYNLCDHNFYLFIFIYLFLQHKTWIVYATIIWVLSHTIILF